MGSPDAAAELDSSDDSQSPAVLESPNRQLAPFLYVSAVAVVAIIASIGGVSALLGSQSTATTHSISQPTPTPARDSMAQQSLSGYLLFHDMQGGISASLPNGQSVRQLVSGDNVGYAGINSAQDTIYYVEPDPANGTIKLVSYNQHTQQRIVLLHFLNTHYFDGHNTATSADMDDLVSVKPSQDQALVTTDQGLELYQLKTLTSKVVLAQQDCVQPISCAYYYAPRWTGEANTALIKVGHLESCSSAILDIAGGEIRNAVDSCDAYLTNHGLSLITGGCCGMGPSAGASYYPTLNAKPVNLFKTEWQAGDFDGSTVIPLPNGHALVWLTYSHWDKETNQIIDSSKAWEINPIAQVDTPANFIDTAKLGEGFDSPLGTDNQHVLVIDRQHLVWVIDITTGNRTSVPISATELIAVLPANNLAL